MHYFYYRSLNVIFGMVNLALIYCITSQLHGLKQVHNFFLSLLPFLNIGTFKSRSSNVRGGGMVSRPFEKARVKKRKKEKGEKTKGKKGEIRSKKARLFVLTNLGSLIRFCMEIISSSIGSCAIMCIPVLKGVQVNIY